MNKGLNSYNTTNDTNDERLSLDVFTEEILPHINKYILPKGEGVIVDVGCGNGRLNIFLHKYYEKVLCVDLHIEALSQRWMYPNCEFYKTELAGLEYDGKVDCILFFTSFYLMVPYEQIFKLCYYFLKEKGIIVISDDEKRKRGEAKDTYYDLDKLAKDTGFLIEHEFVQKNGCLRTTILRKGET